MRLNRSDRIAGVHGLQLRRYFQRFGSEQVNYATVMDELSVTKRQAEKLLTELLKLEMISRCEFQHDTCSSGCPEGVVSCRCHANCDEWRQMKMKTEKRR